NNIPNQPILPKRTQLILWLDTSNQNRRTTSQTNRTIKSRVNKYFKHH
ncbi:uncharacterized protein METZ01_LOCUS145946, partial [marine metagenome]